MKNYSEKIFAQKWLPFAVIFALGFVLYAQTFFFGFSYLDDNTLILDNENFLSHISNVFVAFRTDVFHLFNHSAFYYRPIFTLTLIADYQFFGAAPFMFHFSSVLWHIAAACLVFIFLQKLAYKKEPSFLMALIFLAHPVLAQAVAWVPGRNDSLLAVFILAAAIYFVDFWKSGEKKYFYEHLFFFALAIFTKETALFALPVFLFCAWLLGGRKILSWKNVKTFSLWPIVLLFWFILRHFALNGGAAMSMADMFKSVFLNLPATIQFIGKIIFPFNLSVLPIVQDTVFYYGIAAVILLVILTFLTKNKRGKYILFGLAWFFIFLFPSFIRPNPALVADFIEHRLYLPIVGFFIFLLEIAPLKNWKEEKRIYVILALVVIFIFGAITLSHTRVFKSRLSFWQNATENSPHYPLARRNLGAMYYLDGDMEKSEKEFRAALELNPEEEMAHNNLGLIYTQQNKFTEAEKEYAAEIANNPYYDNAYFNFGILYYKQNKITEAIAKWDKTLEINPTYHDALLSLAGYYYNQKDYNKAVAYAEKAYALGFSLPPELSELLKPLTLMKLNSASAK